MGVKHCGLETLMSQQFLDIEQARAVLEQVGREAVALMPRSA
jgi:hypothetical protein